MKRPAALRNAIVQLWSDDRTERLAALRSLHSLAVDMGDIRSAQPRLVACLVDESAEVREAALDILEYRADMGADIGIAVPQLLTMQHDPDPETRRKVRLALHCANQRLKGLLATHLADSEHPSPP